MSKITEKSINYQLQDYPTLQIPIFSTYSCLAQLTDLILIGMDKVTHAGF